MVDFTTQLAALRAIRASVTDPAQAAALDGLITQLAAEAQARTHTQSISNDAQVGVAVAGDIHGNVYLDGRRADEATRLLAVYLRQVRGRCGTLPLEGVRQQKQFDDVLAVSLDQVYTQLAIGDVVSRETITGQKLRTFDFQRYLDHHRGANLLPSQLRTQLVRPMTDEEEEEEEEQEQEQEHQRDVRNRAAHDPTFSTNTGLILDIVRQNLDTITAGELADFAKNASLITFLGPRLVTDAIADNPRLVLLGEPGSGKSTALRYLALTLAEAGLNQQTDLPMKLAGWERLPEAGKLLPVFVPLQPFARLLIQDQSKSGSAAELWHYLADQLEPGNVRTGLAEAVHAELSAGRVLLMLDGLDEVAGEESRRKVVRAVRLFAEEYPDCRMVVSCRVRAYEGEQNRAWQLPGWPTATLAEWEAAQIQHFIAAWYDAAVAAGGLAEAQLQDRVAALQRAVAASQDLQRLASRPLLLTIMALVHLNDGRLPEDRVALYSRCIDILLGQWELRGREQTFYGSLMDYIGLPDRDVQRLRPLLTKAAFAAQQASSKDSPGSLGRETLRAMVAEHLAKLDHADPYRGAQKFLEYTDHRAGLLQASTAGDAYVFPHLTFQEYLAGLELSSGVGEVARMMEHRADDRWRVPIFLGIGDYVSGNKLGTPYQFLNELRVAEGKTDERYQRDLIFAAEIAEDVGWDRLVQGGAAFRQLQRDLAGDLVAVVEGKTLPAAERVRAGVLLGHLGDPRPGACSLPPAMVNIEGGEFLIGSTPEEAEQAGIEYEQYYLEQGDERTAKQAKQWPQDEINEQLLRLTAFELAHYPVTNAQYAVFIANDGYNSTDTWWDDAGRAWLQRDDQQEKDLQSYQRRTHKTQPELWDDERFGKLRPNHPVVGVSWYEAVAFCRWLTEYLGDGYLYRLPSEAEWEYAARGVERRPYPWGKDLPDGERANYNQTYNGTSAVGSFPLGATPEGVQDMAGNVYEWTASVYGAYDEELATEWQTPQESANKIFTIRGGGWNNQPLDLRASNRFSYFTPGLHGGDVGFRLARHLPKIVKD